MLVLLARNDRVFSAAEAGAIMAVLAMCLAAGGCVERRMMIRTNPPGALAYIDDYEIGTTPIATNFTYYGTHKIRLVKDGYETLTLMQNVPPPWYEIFPLDFVSENLVPGEIRDQRCLNYQLTPQLIVPPEQLLARGESLRHGSQPAAGAAASAPAVRVNPAAPPIRPYPETGPVEVIPAPAAGIGGQPVYPLPPR
jgi:hypothetical protein